jgi:hypothetical protein
MLFSDIFNYFIHSSKSIGLPPLVLICTIALFFFIFIFGLVILNKVRRIRKNLMVLNSGLRTLNQRLQSEMVSLKSEIIKIKKGNENSELKFQEQGANKPVDQISNRLNLPSETDDQTRIRAKNSADLKIGEDEILDDWGKMSEIKSKILLLLKMSNRPVSYSEIAKYIANDSHDYDFEFILKELEQLKTEGEIISQVSAGKLYFQKK